MITTGTATLSGPALKTSYPFSMCVWLGGPQYPGQDFVPMLQSGTTGGNGSGGALVAQMTGNGVASYAIDSVSGFGGQSAQTSGGWQLTPPRFLLVVFVSASLRRVYYDSNTPGADGTGTIGFSHIGGHTLVRVGDAVLPASAQFGEFHGFGTEVTSAQVALMRSGTKPEDIPGHIDGWTLKDYSAGGTYLSITGTRTLTASGAMSAGTLPHPINRTVAGPTVTTQPTNQTVSAGATAGFTAAFAASGGGTLSYQWQRNGTNISGATSASYTTGVTTVSGGTDNNGDTYRCVGTETGGTSPGSTNSSSATLTVNAGSSVKAGVNYFYRKGHGNV